ncbi:MAG: hypothetical protein R3F10_11770 [Lysobacteraceae bacterium]
MARAEHHAHAAAAEDPFDPVLPRFWPISQRSSRSSSGTLQCGQATAGGGWP